MGPGTAGAPLSADAGSQEPVAQRTGESRSGAVYPVDATGAAGVLIGDQSTQINYFYQRTWTDGVAPQPLVSVSGTIDSPYRGLRAFAETDAAFFFGRETAVDGVLARLAGCFTGTGLLVVSGVSGAGKSSLVQAGVLHQLRGAGLDSAPEAAAWPGVVFVPGARPLDELALRIAPVLGGADAASVRQGLIADPAGFALTARQAALSAQAVAADTGPADRARRVLLVVDQFETLFTQCEREDERQAFVRALAAAASAGAAIVVLVIRADLEARLADYPALAAAVQDRYLLTAMTERQLRLAITQPAVRAGAAVDDTLVEVLIGEVRSHASPGDRPSAVGAGVLPLLSHALDQAWRRRTGPGLTLADYERTGGIEGAVASSAQRAYEALTAPQRAAARQVFTRLTATTADGLDTAVRAARADLLAGKDETQARDVDAVLETFAAERLVTLAAGFVEISHEVLLTAWPLLRDDWLASTRADRAARTRLQATVSEWVRASRDRAYLYTGSRLETAQQAAASIAADPRHAALSADERDFLGASRVAAGRRTRLRRGLTAVVAALAVGLAVALVLATQNASGLRRERNVAVTALDVSTSGRLAAASLTAASTDPLTARRESVMAWALDPTSPQARYALLATAANPFAGVLRTEGTPVSAAYSPNGRILAVGELVGSAPQVDLFDPATGLALGGPLRLKGVPAQAHAPITQELPTAFSPDGQTLAVGDGSAVVMWNMASRHRTATYANLANTIQSLAFTPDGQTLAVGGYQCTRTRAVTGCAELLHSATGVAEGAPFPDGSGLVAFARHGTTLATADGSGSIQLWDTTTRRQADVAFAQQGYPVATLAFSPDGRTLATVDVSGAVALWNAATGQQLPAALSTYANAKLAGGSVTFSPDGAMIAIGGPDGAIQVVNVATYRKVGVNLAGGRRTVIALAFSPDGARLASVDLDGTVRLWNQGGLAGRQASPAIRAAAGDAVAVALGPQQALVSTEAGKDSFTVWNAGRGQQRIDPGALHFLPPEGGVSEGPALPPPIALSPDGATMASGARDGTVRLWSLRMASPTARPAVRLVKLPHDIGEKGSPRVELLAFSPDSRELTVAYDNGELQVFDVATGQPVGAKVVTSSTGQIFALSFSPVHPGDLTTLESNGAVSTWDPRGRRPVNRPVSTVNVDIGIVDIGIGQANYPAAFSPDGMTLAISEGDGTVRLLDVETNQRIGASIVTGDAVIGSLAFSPDGTTLATGGNGTIRLWNVSYLVTARVLSQLCADLGGTVSRPQWAREAPGVAYRNACP